MKHELQRIEATLDQLSEPPRSSGVSSGLPPTKAAIAAGERFPSFEVRKKSVPSSEVVESTMPSEVDRSTALALINSMPSCAETLTDSKTPSLPKLKPPSFSSHRNAANPALATSLLKEIDAVVSGWQTELQQVLRQIQDLYLEGPIIDGWLESYTHEDGTVSTLRHADVACLMDYVEKQWGAADLPASKTDDEAAPETAAPGYRLCGLNDDGQLWFRHCPMEQLGAVSLAIARYQKLRQLLGRKQHLETHLGQLAETLVKVHSKLLQDL